MIRRLLTYVGAALFLVFLQGAVLSTWISPGYPMPQLLVPAIVLIAFQAPNLSGLVSSLFLAFLFDLFSGGPWGVWTAVSVATFVVVSLVARQMFVKSLAVIAVLSAAATFLDEVIGACMVQSISEISGGVFYQALKDAVVTSMVSPAFFLIGKRFFFRKKTF